MRLFIAIPLPKKAKEKLAELQQKIPGVRKARPEQMHMTLRFIGDADPGEWIKKMDSIEEAPFKIVLDRIGAFPEKKRIRVLWAGCGPSQSLLNIHRVIGEGEPSPHVTLARFREPPGEEVKSLVGERIRVEFGVDRIVLFNSTLGPGGATHEVVHEKTL